MSEVTQILDAIERGNPDVCDDLLPLVYDELRQLARSRLAQERGNVTLQATALVHEAYMRLLRGSNSEWSSSKHFFRAAAKAMRHIVIDYARKQHAQKRGGDRKRVALTIDFPGAQRDGRLLQLDEALTELEAYDARKAAVVQMRFFAGLTNEETAAALDISPATAERDWTFAKAWLRREIGRAGNA